MAGFSVLGASGMIRKTALTAVRHCDTLLIYCCEVKRHMMNKRIWRIGISTALCLFVLAFAAPVHADEYEDHILLRDKDVGVCSRLVGDTVLSVVLVDVPSAAWADADKEMLAQEMDSVAAWLETEAGAYGASLSVNVQYYAVSAQEELAIDGDYGTWTEQVLGSDASLPCLSSGPVLFCLHTLGRDFAVGNTDAESTEYAVIFCADQPDSIGHELLHLYGASDYYACEGVASAARQLWNDSIMLSNEGRKSVDSLTAYVIGWTDTLDAAAEAMLANTAAYAEEWDGAQVENVRDGFYTEDTPQFVYNGFFRSGTYHGWGTLQWNDGECYEGQWQWGVQDGFGTYRWQSGDTYTGEYAAGIRSGVGKLTYADGTTAVGMFQDGELHGLGAKRYPDGNVYAGRFVHGQMQGVGTLLYANGSKYVGEFADGNYHGDGTMVYENGTAYIGEYVNGSRHGNGTMVYSGESVYVGGFADGKYSGQGTVIHSDGCLYAGGFYDGEYTGSGSLVYGNGDIYAGEFVRGKRQGDGIMLHADGTVYLGQFFDGCYQGQGVFFFTNGDIYSGAWTESSRSGQGTYVFCEKGCYVGEFRNSKRHGYGTYTADDGTEQAGFWAEGQFVGENAEP